MDDMKITDAIIRHKSKSKVATFHTAEIALCAM